MKLSREIKVGLLFIAAVAVFIWGFNYLKGKDIFSLEPRSNWQLTKNKI